MNKLLKISMVITCYNEKKSVKQWAQSFLEMSHQPAELIIVDSKSNDGCIKLLTENLKSYKGNLVLVSEKCNIARGRNLGIHKAKHHLIGITDFGVILSHNWLIEVYTTLQEGDVCAGSYVLTGSNKLQQSYNELFQRDLSLLDESTFLPSSRSFGINKERLQIIGYYKETLKIAEDTEFVNRIRAEGFKIIYNRKALVCWTTRENLKQLFLQHFRYSYWDAIARQSTFRYLHQLYVLALFSCLVLPSMFFSYSIGLIFFLAMSSLLVIRKAMKSGKQKNFLLKCIIYNTVLSASALGYLLGRFKHD